MPVQGEVHLRQQVQVLPPGTSQRATQVSDGTSQGAEADPGVENEEHEQGLVPRGTIDENPLHELASAQDRVRCEGKATARQNAIFQASLRTRHTTGDSLPPLQG